MTQIQKLTVKGYKSIQTLEDFELRPLNVLIGANGAGKSNFISLFKFLHAIADETGAPKPPRSSAYVPPRRGRTRNWASGASNVRRIAR